MFLEAEWAKLLMKQSQMKELEGDIKAATEILQDVPVCPFYCLVLLIVHFHLLNIQAYECTYFKTHILDLLSVFSRYFFHFETHLHMSHIQI